MFFQEEISLLRLGSFYRRTIFVIYNVYCVLKCGIPVLFLYHGNIPSGRLNT